VALSHSINFYLSQSLAGVIALVRGLRINGDAGVSETPPEPLVEGWCWSDLKSLKLPLKGSGAEGATNQALEGCCMAPERPYKALKLPLSILPLITAVRPFKPPSERYG